MPDRFAIRPDSQGFSVVDRWSGEPAVIAMTAQTGLSERDAGHTADMLNQRHNADAEKLLQAS